MTIHTKIISGLVLLGACLMIAAAIINPNHNSIPGAIVATLLAIMVTADEMIIDGLRRRIEILEREHG